MFAEAICDIARPVLQLLPTGRIRVLRWLGGAGLDDRRWELARHRHRVFYDKVIDAYVCADLADWTGRWHYYSGRFWDRLNQLVIDQVLRTGDIYVDVGANLGMHSLLASRRVGADGMVVAIEPNPRTFHVLQLHSMINRIDNITLWNLGMSDHEGKLELIGDPSHSAMYSAVDHGQGTDRVEIKLEMLDNILRGEDLNRARVLVKIDVEGHECNVLAGMKNLLARRNVVVSLEVTPAWIEQAGRSVDELLALLTDAGYRILSPVRRRSPFRETSWVLTDGSLPRTGQRDVVLVSEQSAEFLGSLYQEGA